MRFFCADLLLVDGDGRADDGAPRVGDGDEPRGGCRIGDWTGYFFVRDAQWGGGPFPFVDGAFFHGGVEGCGFDVHLIGDLEGDGASLDLNRSEAWERITAS